jgi:hypothetical protein
LQKETLVLGILKVAEQKEPMSKTLKPLSSYKSIITILVIVVIIISAAFIDTPLSQARAARERAKKSEEANQMRIANRGKPVPYETQDIIFLSDNSPSRGLFDKAYQGDSDSQFELCLEYMRGTELSKDLIKAFAWLKLAFIYKKERPLPEEFTKVENEIKGQLSPTDEKAASTLAYQINKEIEAKIAAEKTGK